MMRFTSLPIVLALLLAGCSAAKPSTPSDGGALPACVNGHCSVTLAQTGPGPCALAVDATDVYWSNFDTGATTATASDNTIQKAPLDGGPPTTLASGVNGACSLAVDSKNVYFATGDGSLESVPLAGGAIATLLSPGAGMPYSYTVVGVQGANLIVLTSNASIVSLPTSGGDGGSVITALDNNESGTVFVASAAIDSSNAYWSVGQFIPQVTSTGDIGEFPLDGGAPPQAPPIATSVTSSAFIASNGSAVAYADTPGDASVVMSVPVSGGAPTTVASGIPLAGRSGTEGVTLIPLAIDQASVYWVAPFCAAPGAGDAGCPVASRLMKAPVGGGAPELLAEVNAGILQLAVDDTSVYWITGSSGSYAAGSVMKVTPK